MTQAVLDFPGKPSDQREDAPLSVPPSFRVAAVASVAGLRDSRGNFPVDACVPMLADGGTADALDGRATLVLLHVDGVQSLQQIAARTDLSLPETIAVCLDLVALGVVNVASPEEARAMREAIHRDA